MKKIIATVAILMAVATVAQAACPAYSPYRCVPGYNGKMICGCGM